MQRVNCTEIYREEKVPIIGNDVCIMDILLLIILIDMPGLPTIEFDEDKLITNQVCQDLLDK